MSRLLLDYHRVPVLQLSFCSSTPCVDKKRENRDTSTHFSREPDEQLIDSRQLISIRVYYSQPFN